MTGSVLVGFWRRTIRIPGFAWRRAIRSAAASTRAAQRFMTDEHHRVRDHAVRELARTGAPLPPPSIADALELPLPRVAALLDELERRLTYLFRDAAGAVEWAYPFTASETPHRVRFDRGPPEPVHAA
ncbi:MAG: hypothetical protein H6713_02250 [Myxococcales bacterium]|nr:hypothetical protein [Myxococcales bacterium]MCB9748808.1 hypothetical protein [Myxococcales bacterium]